MHKSHWLRCCLIPLAFNTCLLTQASAQGTERPSAVPLITHDPYFSIWSDTDKLTDSSTRHWTGHP